ncbi:extracellular solute-binding protein [Paenibacillus sp.]|uniref:extracellular solute-binding protein n=1 Tax=Paenibacillus sp. TaxID=58172 RepID=UPI002D2F1C5D|nr:extracellular solute-binding protein [Paenibacillus sp.]HZG86277.1 extracellular solute-binding protein [Paenibacillus sp.]
MIRRKQAAAAIASMLCLSLAVTACSGGSGGGGGGAGGAANSSESGGGASGGASGTSGGASTEQPAAEADPLFGKYEPGIEISTVRVIDELKFADGDDIDNNVWTRTLKERLGITINNQWVVKRDLGQEKMNVTLASGDLPDIFGVSDPTQLKQLVDSEQVYDLTELYEKHASPLVKEFAEATTNGLAAATFDGKLMAFPAGNATIDNAPILWIRKDWLAKLNLPEPQTMDDVLRIADAFANQDPDGNGKKDSYGLALNKTLFWANGGGAFGSLEGFFNGYRAYPQSWIKDANGNLAYGSIQPEMKAALAQLQEMYKNGLIDKEFGVKDESKEAELANAGKLGMGYGMMWNTLWPLNDGRKNDPNTDWQAYPIVSADGNPAKPQTPALSVTNYYVVNKHAKNPEALFKMLNLFAELQFDPKTPKEVWEQHSKINGIETWTYYPYPVGRPDKNLKIHHKVVATLKSRDPSGLNPEELDAYNNSLAMAEGTGDANAWGYDKVFGPEGSFKVIDKYVTEKLLQPSEFYVAPTATMVDKNATLLKMEQETFTKIIMGSASVDDFDTFVSNWKKLGGDQITAEVNEWYQSK